MSDFREPLAREINRFLEVGAGPLDFSRQLKPVVTHRRRTIYAFLPWSMFRVGARARFLSNRGRLAQVSRLLDAEIGRIGATPELLLRRANIRIEAGLPDGAVTDLRRVVELSSAAPETYFRLGSALIQLGRLAEGREALDSCLTANEDHWLARLWRADVLLRLGRFEAGENDLARCRLLSPRSFLPSLIAGRHGRLRALDEAVAAARGNLWPLWTRGWISLSQGDAESAERDLTRALTDDPECRWGYLLRVQARHALGDEPGAAEDLEKAMALGPDLNCATVSWQEGDALPSDMLFLNRVLRSCPDNTWARVWRGQLYFDLLRPDKALADLDAADSATTLGWARALKARAQALWKGELYTALAETTRAMEDSPQCGWITAWRGLLRFKGGDLPGAREDYDTAVRMAPLYPLGYSWRAALRARMGDSEGALEDLACAAELDPHYGSNHDRRRQIRLSLGEFDGALEDMDFAVRREMSFSWSPQRSEGGDAEAIKALDRRLSAQPRDSRALAWRGETHLRFGRWREAIADLDAALRLRPDFAWAWAWRGESARRLGETKRAVGDLSRAIRLDPSFAAAFGWRARAWLELDQRDKALADLNQTLRLDFGCAWAYVQRAQIHSTRGNKSAAAADLLRARCLDRNSAVAELGPVLAALKEGDADRAIAEIARALGVNFKLGKSLSPWHNPEQDLIYAVHWRASKDFLASDRRALALVVRARKHWPQSAHLTALSGMLRLYVRDLEGAMQDLDRAISAAPDFAWAYIWRFSCRTIHARQRRSLVEMAGVFADLDKALELDPRNVHALALRAELKHDRDQREEALSDVVSILKIDSSCAWAYAERGEILTEMERLPEALRDFDQLISWYPKQPWPYALRGRALANSGRLKQSLPDLDKALMMRSQWGSAAAWRGEVHRKLGNFRQAIIDFDRALDSDPGYILAYAWRGHAYLTDGQLDKAIRDLTQAISRDRRHMMLFAWRGEAYFKNGRFREAARDFDQVFPAHPKVAWSLGEGLADREKALEESLEGALRRHPRCAWVRAFRGRVLVDSARRDLCFEEFARALKLAPDFPWALAWRAEAWRRAGRLKEALQDASQALRLDRAEFFGSLWRARVFLDLGRPEHAKRDLDAALALRPDSAQAYRYRGEAQIKIGDRRAGLADLDVAVFLQGKDAEIRAFRDQASLASGVER